MNQTLAERHRRAKGSPYVAIELIESLAQTFAGHNHKTSTL